MHLLENMGRGVEGQSSRPWRGGNQMGLDIIGGNIHSHTALQPTARPQNGGQGGSPEISSCEPLKAFSRHRCRVISGPLLPCPILKITLPL